MKYIDYHNANDFYTIDEACDELNLSKKELQRYSEKHKIPPDKTNAASMVSQKLSSASCTTTSTRSRKIANSLPLRRHRERIHGHEK
jgi:hypothetical protein